MLPRIGGGFAVGSGPMRDKWGGSKDAYGGGGHKEGGGLPMMRR